MLNTDLWLYACLALLQQVLKAVHLMDTGAVQGRGGDDLAADYAKALERSMYAGLNGVGKSQTWTSLHCFYATLHIMVHNTTCMQCMQVGD